MEDAPDGLTIRALTPEDREALRRFPERVSPRSAVTRFHGALAGLSEPMLDLLLDLAPGSREAVVALDANGIVGVARYARDDPSHDTAEIAVLIADEWQHRGVAHRLFRPLADRALAAGITRFRGDVLAENRAARDLLAHLAPIVGERIASGRVILTLDLLGGGTG